MRIRNVSEAEFREAPADLKDMTVRVEGVLVSGLESLFFADVWADFESLRFEGLNIEYGYHRVRIVGTIEVSKEGHRFGHMGSGGSTRIVVHEIEFLRGQVEVPCEGTVWREGIVQLEASGAWLGAYLLGPIGQFVETSEFHRLPMSCRAKVSMFECRSDSVFPEEVSEGRYIEHTWLGELEPTQAPRIRASEVWNTRHRTVEVLVDLQQFAAVVGLIGTGGVLSTQGGYVRLRGCIMGETFLATFVEHVRPSQPLHRELEESVCFLEPTDVGFREHYQSAPPCEISLADVDDKRIAGWLACDLLGQDARKMLACELEFNAKGRELEEEAESMFEKSRLGESGELPASRAAIERMRGRAQEAVRQSKEQTRMARKALMEAWECLRFDLHVDGRR